MVLSEVNKFLHELEKAELEAPGGVASSQTYAQLLAVYLYQNDLPERERFRSVFV